MRLRYNNCYGSLGGAQLSGDTSVTFAAALTYDDGTAVPTIAAPDTLEITVDPFSASFEVERITAYTSGATTATVTRAIKGTAKGHNNAASFGHDPTDDDWLPDAASRVAMRAALR